MRTRRKFHAENSICALPVCGYVASMNWSQILILAVVIGITVAFVWRSSKKSGGCGCGCAHEEHPEKKKNH